MSHLDIEGMNYMTQKLYKMCMDAAYPIGKIWESSDPTNPQDMFTWQKWERIEDKQLVAAGNKYKAGTIIGSDEHTLTVAELPEHDHKASSDNAGTHTHNEDSNGTHMHNSILGNSGEHSHTGTADSVAEHQHQTWGEHSNISPWGIADGNLNHIGTNGGADYDNTTVWTGPAGGHGHSLTINNSGAHSHTISINNSGSHVHTIKNAGEHNHKITIGFTGSGAAFSVLSTSLVVYMWRRTA